jgi:hypothetical protein
VRDHLHVLPGVLLGHVVVVVVGEQQRPDGDAQTVSGLQQRSAGTAGVDHERRPALLVGHQVGVRQPLVVHGSLDDHGAAKPSIRRP